MKVIKVTFYWKSGQTPTHYYFDNCCEMLVWAAYCLRPFVKDIATLTVESEVVKNEEN